MSSSAPIFVSAEEIRSLLDYKSVIEAVEQAMIVFSTRQSELQQPMRTVVPTGNGMLMTMPCFSAAHSALCCKVLTIVPGQQPSHQGLVTLFCPENGRLLALMDAEEVTRMRTAAASAAASKALARPGSDSLALIGCGEQAFSHFEALSSAFQLRRVTVCGRRIDRAEALVQRLLASPLRLPGCAITACDSVQEAVSNCDIVCTVTSSRQPVLHADWLRDDCHVNAVGACRPDERELDQSVMDAAFLVVDSRESASKESGDVVASGAQPQAELGELLAKGTRRQDGCRQDGRRLSVFKSLGLAVQDAVTAKLVWDRRCQAAQ